MITQERLKELLRYDKETGQFYWRVRSNSKVEAGCQAGTVAKEGHIVISIDSKKYYAHRLVWLYCYGHFPSEQIDHINHNKIDNRLFNLREVSHLENDRNHPKQRNNTSGVTGVCWDKHANKWIAQIQVNGKMNHLGLFSNFNEAVKVRKEAELKYGFHENHGK